MCVCVRACVRLCVCMCVCVIYVTKVCNPHFVYSLIDVAGVTRFQVGKRKISELRSAYKVFLGWKLDPVRHGQYELRSAYSPNREDCLIIEVGVACVCVCVEESV